MNKVVKIGVVVLILIAIVVSTASAQEVTRSFDKDPVLLGQTVRVTLSAAPGAIGVRVIETYPVGFTFVNWTYSGANNVAFSQSGNTLTFIVTDINADGYTITYTLQAPTTEGTYTFTGTYEAMGLNPANIAGDSVLSVSSLIIDVTGVPIPTTTTTTKAPNNKNNASFLYNRLENEFKELKNLFEDIEMSLTLLYQSKKIDIVLYNRYDRKLSDLKESFDKLESQYKDVKEEYYYKGNYDKAIEQFNILIGVIDDLRKDVEDLNSEIATYFYYPEYSKQSQLNPLYLLFLLLILIIPAVIYKRKRPRRSSSSSSTSSTPSHPHSPQSPSPSSPPSPPPQSPESPSVPPTKDFKPELRGFPQELLTKYQPLKYLGEGGFAKVFKCKRLNDGKIVAVKIPKVSNDFVRRSFLKEVAAWFNLNHPNIVKLYDADYKPIEHIEVEFIEGVEVNGKIVRDLDEYPKPVDESTAIKLIKGIAEGLSHAHSRGIIHRDLKPLNILLTPSLIPKITDWGLAKLASSSTTTPALSPLYAAPEQIDSAKYGKPDHRTDIYQLGLIFYELLTGKSPYEGYTPAAIAGKILSEEIKPPLPSKFNPELVKYDGIIERMLAKRKEDRYQSVEEFLKQLESIGKLQAELEELKKTLSETKQSLRRSRSKEEIERLTKEAVEKTAKIAILSAKLNDKVGLISALEDMKLYTKENLDELLNAISQIELMMNEGIPISDDFVNMIEVLLHRIVRENR